jgi:hypothetical protein
MPIFEETHWKGWLLALSSNYIKKKFRLKTL